MSIIEKTMRLVFGTHNVRELKKILPVLEAINALENRHGRLNDAELKDHARDLRRRASAGETPDALMPEAFSLAREAARRALGMRPYDVQLLASIVLHRGAVAEMKTGEGKTLAAVPVLFLNSLNGRGVHAVTVNDYLAKRDAQWMRPVFELLDTSVGYISHGMDSRTRREAYAADITYAGNNEIAFDYLRDNMVVQDEDRVQRGLTFALVDEADSIFIDEAHTPLIIAGEARSDDEIVLRARRAAETLIKRARNKPGPRNEAATGREASSPDEDLLRGRYYDVHEKNKNVTLTEPGVRLAEKILSIENLYSSENIDLSAAVSAALRARLCYQPGTDYLVREGEVVLIDEFTGYALPGRRYGGGLHQALEAREGVALQPETRTMASISFQNFFRMYEKLSGMTGTAAGSATEFHKIHRLPVIAVPTHRPVIRRDFPDRLYATEAAKLRAVVAETGTMRAKGRPVLLGTASVEKSERLSRLLRRAEIPHEVLNAKHHERESEIIANAGRPGTVTVATNMAGRGTDIILGGSGAERNEAEAVRARDAGGLHVIGTERHEARRIDDQLRGRSGRQGDPGSSRFYLSLEDPLLRMFAGTGSAAAMKALEATPEGYLEGRFIDGVIARAQKRVESRNYDIRKHLLDYDDVLNAQRERVYRLRRKLLERTPRDGYFPLELLDELWCEQLENLENMREGAWSAGLVGSDPLVEYRLESFRAFGEITREFRGRYRAELKERRRGGRLDAKLFDPLEIHPELTSPLAHDRETMLPPSFNRGAGGASKKRRGRKRRDLKRRGAADQDYRRRS